jgi:hypothetical protein
LPFASFARVAALCGALGLALGCGGRGAGLSQPEAPIESVADSEAGNLLRNGSFEHGRKPWYAFEGRGNPAWLPYEDSAKAARSGKRGARLALTSNDFPAGAEHGIRGALQRIDVETLPRTLRGAYRVESWSPSPPAHLYVQLVVAAIRPKNMEPASLNRLPVQLALSLAGLDAPPFAIRNRKFVFVGPAQPVMEEWIPFELDLHEISREQWGLIPEGMAAVLFYFEARFDGKIDPAVGPAEAVVYFDDLYLGD